MLKFLAAYARGIGTVLKFLVVVAGIAVLLVGLGYLLMTWPIPTLVAIVLVLLLGGGLLLALDERGVL